MNRAAVVHPKATLSPSKIDLLRSWLPQQAWFAGDPADLTQAARFRFVDPDGEVGLDSMVVASAGGTYYVPLTWRADPLEGAAMIGTLEHSELGTRYGYDAATDPVFMAELERVIREAGTHAEIHDESGNVLPLAMFVRGSGVVPGEAPDARLDVVRVLDRFADVPGYAIATLMGDWTDNHGPRRDVLAILR